MYELLFVNYLSGVKKYKFEAFQALKKIINCGVFQYINHYSNSNTAILLEVVSINPSCQDESNDVSIVIINATFHRFWLTIRRVVVVSRPGRSV